MIKTLYEKFQHWSEGGSVYLISDPHFGPDNECLQMNPNYLPAAHPDEYVNLLNNQIRKNDTLICLGDCGNIEHFRKLKAGYKVLIMGNHCTDHGVGYYKRKEEVLWFKKEDYETRQELKEYIQNQYPNYKFRIMDGREWYGWKRFNEWFVILDNNLFDEVYDGPLFISDQILLSHEPIDGLKFCCNINGHSHGGKHDYTDELGGRHLNIAADVVGYIPLDLNKLIKAGLTSKLPTIHRITINRATENSRAKE